MSKKIEKIEKIEKKEKRKGKKVLVALSGGVDSSVAALILAEQGYEVVAAHMKLWDYASVGGDLYRDGRGCSMDSITDCRFVCDKIGAPFYVFNFSTEFKKQVIEDFVAEYQAGRTPNPCVRCNSLIKWDRFLQKAAEIGCDTIATGHYAHIEKNDTGRWQIREGADSTRDQSYVLWGLSQEALSRTLMPLGGIEKTEVRRIAREHGLATAEKAESREICFVADDDYRRFLKEYQTSHSRGFEPGEIVHENGQVMGEHAGTAYYTIGQRRGLGIAHKTPLYVKQTDPVSRTVTVAEDASIKETEFIVEGVNWIAIDPPTKPLEVEVKIRYLGTPGKATIRVTDRQRVIVTYADPQRAIAPGQSAVFYDRGVVLGGGVIASRQIG